MMQGSVLHVVTCGVFTFRATYSAAPHVSVAARKWSDTFRCGWHIVISLFQRSFALRSSFCPTSRHFFFNKTFYKFLSILMRICHLFFFFCIRVDFSVFCFVSVKKVFCILCIWSDSCLHWSIFNYPNSLNLFTPSTSLHFLPLSCFSISSTMFSSHLAFLLFKFPCFFFMFLQVPLTSV